MVLGVTIPAGGGIEDGEKVLDILARHPSTARFISRKLAMRFVADDPPASLVERMAQTFLKTDGDLRAVMETMLEFERILVAGRVSVEDEIAVRDGGERGARGRRATWITPLRWPTRWRSWASRCIARWSPPGTPSRPRNG